MPRMRAVDYCRKGEMSKMLIFDFFAGTGSATKAFEDAGHRVIKIELDEQFEAHERDVMTLRAVDLITKYGQPDFVWASPPCTTFSVASIGKHWNRDYTPKTEQAKQALKLIDHTLSLIYQLQPSKGWLIENPRGMLRKVRMQSIQRQTITYCAYGDNRMKPTDLWGYVPGWNPRPACKAGAECHEAAPRGARTGTQGIKGAKNRSMIPYQLSCDLHHIMSDTPRK